MKNPFFDLPRYHGLFKIYLGNRIYIIFLLTLIAALAEGVGILMILPLLESLSSINVAQDSGLGPQAEATPESSTLSEYMTSLIEFLGFEDSIISVLIIITIAFIVKGILTFAALAWSSHLRGELMRELKNRLFKQYSRMNYDYYASKDTGHFINIINEQITRALQSFASFTQLGAFIINTIVYIALAFLVAWRFGLMAFLAGVALLLIFRWLSSLVRDLSRLTAKENGFLANVLIQTLQAYKYLTATDQIGIMKGKVAGSIEKLANYQIRTGIAAGFTQATREPVAVVLIMLILGMQLFYLQQPLEPIIVSIALFYRGLNATLAIQGAWQTMLEYIGSMEIVDTEFKNQVRHEVIDGTKRLVFFDKDIHLDDIYFSYDSRMGNVIDGVTLKIPSQTSVAFVGESGSGKSTLVDLITLMIRPQSGQVLIDQVPGSTILLSSWREKIGYVSQETVIFDDSIANNICLWSGDMHTDAELDKRIRKSASQAYIAQFIEGLPEGYQTLVGERGIRLSGGQRQRLFIARELFRKPSLLILDEATSALDSESEKSIQRSIDELKGQVTLIIIAHRLSTIKNVDKIFVLDKGRIIQDGLYDSLRKSENSQFRRLIEMQEL